MSVELRPEFVVIDVDISGEQSIDTTALEIMEMLIFLFILTELFLC